MANTETALDPRVVHTRAVVLDAAAELLTEHGFERVTIDAIAERSGVARSTIYRNWPDRSHLLAEAFAVMCDFGEIDTGALISDLTTLGPELAHGLVREPWGHVLPSLIGAAAHDTELRHAQAEFSARRRDMTGAIFQRAIDRGELPADASSGDLGSQFAAPFFYRRLMSHQPLDDDFVNAHVAALVERAGVGS